MMVLVVSGMDRRAKASMDMRLIHGVLWTLREPLCRIRVHLAYQKH